MIYITQIFISFSDPELFKNAKKILRHATSLLFIFAFTKDTEMYQLFILHQQNIHLLNQLADYLSFDSELSKLSIVIFTNMIRVQTIKFKNSNMILWKWLITELK